MTVDGGGSRRWWQLIIVGSRRSPVVAVSVIGDGGDMVNSGDCGDGVDHYVGIRQGKFKIRRINRVILENKYFYEFPLAGNIKYPPSLWELYSHKTREFDSHVNPIFSRMLSIFMPNTRIHIGI